MLFVTLLSSTKLLPQVRAALRQEIENSTITKNGKKERLDKTLMSSKLKRNWRVGELFQGISISFIKGIHCEWLWEEAIYSCSLRSLRCLAV